MHIMQLLTQKQIAQLRANGQQGLLIRDDGCSFDPVPVVKLFTPDAACTWLLCEIDPEDEDIAYGLCDLGLGSPELGSARLSELATVRGALGLPVERDRHATLDQPVSVYAALAFENGHITL